MRRFLGWVLVGGSWAFVVASAMTIGIFLLPLAVLLTVVVARWDRSRDGLPGLIAGLGLPLLYIAYLNREGPGTVCHSSATSISCTDEWSPWPFLAFGVALVGLGWWLWSSSSRRRIHHSVERGIAPRP
jgi:hypothetical protein